MNGSGSSNSTIATELLPPWVRDVELPRYLIDMQNYSLAVYTPYSGDTYALQDEGFSWTDGQGFHSISNTYETTGLKNLATRGRDGHPLLTKGETLLRNILDGIGINANTKIDTGYAKRAEAIVINFDENILPALARQMNFVGNYGSYAHHILMAKAAEEAMQKLAEIGMETYFKDYLFEKINQVSGINDAINYGDQDAINAEMQTKAGEIQREYWQGKLIDDHNKWMDVQTSTIRRLEIAGNSIRALLGAQKREDVPYYRPSDISQIAGLALAGLGFYGSGKRGQPAQGSFTAGQKALVDTTAMRSSKQEQS